jgi:ubiE/COQ5 methyltransferase family
MNSRPEESAERFFSGNAWSYDHIARVSTLGLDGWWKRKILKKIPKAADRILEQASRTGILTCKIERLVPKSRVIGVELHEEYLKVARKKVRDLELSNVHLWKLETPRVKYGAQRCSILAHNSLVGGRIDSSLTSKPVFRYRDRKSDLWCIRYCISQKIALPLGVNRAMDLNRRRQQGSGRAADADRAAGSPHRKA